MTNTNNTHAMAWMRTALLMGGALAALVSVPAVAQENGGIETIVVTGLRESLQRNLDIKREAPGLVDAITMEDIGKFPDANLANALMRIPGVTTSMTSNMTNNGQSVTTGQGVSITVRGFGPSFNETLFNGRVIPSGVGGRSFDFSGLSADMVSQLHVLKSPDASLSAGAMGATVNVIYPKPFDKPGLTVAAAVSTDLGADDGRWRPNGNFLISDTFDNDRIGILIAGAYSDLSTSQQQFQNWGWIGMTCNASVNSECASPSMLNKPIWFTQDYAVDFNRITDVHLNGRIAVQFRPVDELEITADLNYARDTLDEDSLTYALWNSVGAMTNITRSSNGTITYFNRTAPTDFDDVISQQVQQTYDYGLNAKWTVNDHITLTLDFDQAMSALQPGRGEHWQEISMDIGYGPSQSGGTNGMTFSITQPSGHSIPYYGGVGPNGNSANFLNTSIMGSHVMVVTNQENRNLTNQAKFEGDFVYDNMTFKIGGSYDANHFRGATYNDFTGNQWQIYSGYGPDSNNYYSTGQTAGVDLPSNLFHGTRSIRSIPGWSEPSGGVIPGLVVFNAKEVYAYINSLGVPTCTGGVSTINGFNCSFGTGYTGATPKQMAKFSGNYFIEEDNYAAYVSFSEDTKFAGMPLKINGGVRYEYTDMTTSGLGLPLASMNQSASDHTAYDLVYAAQTTLKAQNNYAYLLPNLDLNLAVTENLHIRFDASRTMTRPPLADLKANVSYSGRIGATSASSGNPEEMPYTSDNIDLSAEWYYSDNSYLSAGTFLKVVNNFVVSNTSTITLNGSDPNVNNGIAVIDSYTGTYATFTLTSKANGPTANVYGLEVAWQHVFGDSGFGLLANGTLVGTNKPYNPDNLSVGSFAVPGLANSANLMAFYDKDGIELRLAANWRDTYLDSFGQGQSSGTQFGSEPIFINGSWNMTLSAGYDITDNIHAYFEADNLTNQAYSSRGRYPDQMYSVIQVGRRFTAGVHFKL
jgi:iron complex outermembrane recepter protein